MKFNIIMLALLVFLYSCKKEEDPHAGPRYLLHLFHAPAGSLR